MLRSARVFALVLAASCTFASVSGCSATAEDDDVATPGDGETAEDDIVSERQLMGGELPPKTINLTFDDGPGARTAELADFLAANGIKATFFINGSKVPGRQSAIDAIVGRGHLLANHTHNHLQLTKLSSEKVVSEIAATDEIIVAAQPNGPSIVRAPFGAWNGAVARAVNATPMKKYVGSVFWDVGGALTATSAADWDCWGKRVTVERCGELYMTEIKTKKRGIVLFHDIHDKTVDMVKEIVPKLIADGFKFAKLEDVPSVKRALAAGSAAPPAGGCSSSSLGRTVAENACVQSVRDRKWYRCAAGEWAASSGPSDTKCTERAALP
jgi:peptidoglycan/xylan/chitin deacetylase (PgdA/CDA1 family)